MSRTMSTVHIAQTVQSIRIGAWVFIQYVTTLARQQLTLAQCTIDWLLMITYRIWAQFIGQRSLTIIHNDGSYTQQNKTKAKRNR